MQIHVPSLAAGIVAAVCLMVFLGADYSNQRQALELGRFELEATENHVFILDRYSGKVWQKFVTDGSGQTDQDFALPKAK